MTAHLQGPSQWRLLRQDVVNSLHNWRFWVYLGWNDIAKQYRRSFIGPVWITVNTAIFIVAFGFVGAQLFKTPVHEYLPFFCAGHILFGFLTVLVNEGCLTFISADAFLKQTPYPKVAFVLRVVWRSCIMLAHNMVVVALVLWWSGHLGEVRWLAFLAAMAATVCAASLVVAILGALSTRFRDIPMMVTSFMQIAFFVTPVMWRPEQLTERAQWLVHLNPFAAFLDILRQPLLGQVASTQSWLAVLGMLPVLALGFAILYRFARRRIVYWL